jgi:uronate dehydrogenase
MESTASPLLLGRVLLTGAAGALGKALRPRLRPRCSLLRVSDIAPMEAAGGGEEVVQVALEDRAGVHALLEGMDAVVHLGGISTEHSFDEVLQANIIGLYNVYEGARRQGVRRIVFASSNHVTGFYRQDQVIDATMPRRPDGYYGLSKAYGEDLSRFYFDRYGLETVCLRIGSAFPEPKDRRMLATWLSYDDLERLVLASLTTPVVGHSIVYGMSDNTTTWWDNTPAKHIGFRPRDSSEPWRAAREAAQPAPDRNDPAVIYQGGAYVRMGPFD